MLDGILQLFTAPGLGAITGLLGGWLTKRENRKILQLKIEERLTMAKIRKEELQLEHAHVLETMDKQIDIAEAEGEIAVESKETDAFVESVKSQKIPTGIWIVDFVRGLMRPVLTIWLVFLTWYIYYQIDDLVDGLDSIPKVELVALYSEIIHQIIFLTVTAVAWWFASRGDKSLVKG